MNAEADNTAHNSRVGRLDPESDTSSPPPILDWPTATDAPLEDTSAAESSGGEGSRVPTAEADRGRPAAEAKGLEAEGEGEGEGEWQVARNHRKKSLSRERVAGAAGDSSQEAAAPAPPSEPEPKPDSAADNPFAALELDASGPEVHATVHSKDSKPPQPQPEAQDKQAQPQPQMKGPSSGGQKAQAGAAPPVPPVQTSESLAPGQGRDEDAPREGAAAPAAASQRAPARAPEPKSEPKPTQAPVAPSPAGPEPVKGPGSQSKTEAQQAQRGPDSSEIQEEIMEAGQEAVAGGAEEGTESEGGKGLRDALETLRDRIGSLATKARDLANDRPFVVAGVGFALLATGLALRRSRSKKKEEVVIEDAGVAELEAWPTTL